jgi:hypothetical protein
MYQIDKSIKSLEQDLFGSPQKTTTLLATPVWMRKLFHSGSCNMRL